MKYKDWLNIWLDNYIKPSTKQRTFNRYSEIVEKHIVKELGGYELNELSPILVQQYVTQLLQNGNIKTGRGLSSNSVNGIITVIQSSLKLAFTMGEIKEYTFDRLKRPKTQEKEVSCFSLQEQKKIENYVLNGKKQKLFGIILCLYSGLRIGELLSLKWEDVDFNRRIINVNKTCYDGKDKSGNFTKIIDTPKTVSSRRIIPLPKQIIPLLKEHKRNSKCEFIVANNGKDISVRSHQRTFELLLKRLKIQHKGFHSLRHTFATRALECGMDVKTLSEILGHKNPTVTLNRYVHSMIEHKAEMMNKLGKILG